MNNPTLEILTPFEDFIVIIRDNYQEERMVRSGWDGGSSERIPASKVYSGEPYQVLAINAPFICCRSTVEDKSFQIDIRHVEWRCVEENYVKGFMIGNGLLKPLPSEKEVQQQKDEKRRCCPICVEPMTERRGTKSGWKMICKSCDVQLTRIER